MSGLGACACDLAPAWFPVVFFNSATGDLSDIFSAAAARISSRFSFPARVNDINLSAMISAAVFLRVAGGDGVDGDSIRIRLLDSATPPVLSSPISNSFCASCNVSSASRKGLGDGCAWRFRSDPS